MIESLKKRNKKVDLGYIQTCCGYWVTTAPKGWKYNSKDKVWVLNKEVI